MCDVNTADVLYLHFATVYDLINLRFLLAKLDNDYDWHLSGLRFGQCYCCHRPPECDQCDNAVFADDIKMASPRLQSGICIV